MTSARNLKSALCAAALAGAFTVVSPVAPSEAEELTSITFLTNYVFHGRHSPFFVGLEKGFYEEEGFDIDIQPATGSGFVVSAIEGAQAHYGMSDASTMVQAAARGASVKAFAVFMDVSPMGLASREPYPTPDSLEGAKIAAGMTDSTRVILPIIFDQHGLDPETINWEAADPSVYISLLLSGQVDLFTASIDGDFPALLNVAGPQGQEVHFSSWADWGYDSFGFFLVTHPDRIDQNPDEVRAFARATEKAVMYAIENPEEAAEIMVRHNPTLNQETTLAQWTQSIDAINTDFVSEAGYGSATPDRLDSTIALVARARGEDIDLSADDIFAQGFAGR